MLSLVPLDESKNVREVDERKKISTSCIFWLEVRVKNEQLWEKSFFSSRGLCDKDFGAEHAGVGAHQGAEGLLREAVYDNGEGSGVPCITFKRFKAALPPSDLLVLTWEGGIWLFSGGLFFF